MKKLIYLFILVPLAIIAQTPSQDQNYIMTTIYQKEYLNGQEQNATDDEKITAINYFDGLGRPVQNIGVKAGGNHEDIVTFITYDAYGRQSKEYLPYATINNGGAFKANALTATNSFYNTVKYENTINPYSEKYFEASLLNRVKEQGAPGSDWVVNKNSDLDHTIKFDYKTNTSATEVRLYSVSLSSDYTPTLQNPSPYYYGVGELYKTITKDENWQPSDGTNRTTEEFKDKQGRVILKRTYNNGQKHDTFYIYDDYGNLTYVLPPKSEATSTPPNATKLAELCYQYKYDNRNRLIEKKIPGKGWEYIIYDKLDRPVLTQDAIQRPNKWLFTKYDAFGRVVYTGEYQDTNTREGMQDMAYNETGIYEENRVNSNTSIPNSSVYYSNNAFPQEISGNDLYIINYYDTYIDLPLGLSNTITTYYGLVSSTLTKGLATVSKVKVLGTTNWITTVIYYDDKARPIYTYTKNDYLQTTDIVENKLDFVGKVIESKTTHKKTGKADIVTIDRFEYDHTGRLIQQIQKINNQISKRLSRNNYDELGQLESKLIDNGTQEGYKDMIGVTIQNDMITATASVGWGNSGFATKGSFKEDGYVEYEMPQTNKYIMIGLSNSNTNAYYNTIQYGLYNRPSGQIQIYESGSLKGGFGTYNNGDIFRVERKDSTVYYKKNGKIFYTSTVPSTGALLGDIAFYSNNGKIKDLKIVDNSKGIQKVDYTYNVRGWLKNINQDAYNDNDLFNFTIMYNDIADTSKKLYNGNISQTSWNTLNTDSSTKTYTYTYDALNRITSATDDTNNYSLSSVTYDKNGNIMSLQRRGHLNSTATSFGVMDNLIYTYDSGNKLKKVLDNGNDTYGFKDGANIATEYTYDQNGNMKTDANKGITSILYNHLNLPTEIKFNNSNTKKINYVYAADRTKIRKITNDNGNVTTTDYAGNFVYENNALKQITQPEGYIEPNGSNYLYVYQYKDHLNNVRLTYADTDGNGTIAQSEIKREQNYYPYGMEHKGYNNTIVGAKNNLKTFQGQEFTEDLGLNTHEWKYRISDPSIGRFWQVDPLAEKYQYNSTYAFQENKMGMGIELEGLEVVYRKGASPEFKEKFAKTVKFMNSKGTSGMLAELNESGRTEIVDNTGGVHGEGTFYKPSEGAIYWDPEFGIKTDEGHLLTPATVLNHEIDHANQHKNDPKQMKKDLKTPDSQYDNAEEKRVITGSEQKTAKKHGEIKKNEVTRKDHQHGTSMTFPDPTSTNNATQKVNELEEVIVTTKRRN